MLKLNKKHYKGTGYKTESYLPAPKCTVVLHICRLRYCAYIKQHCFHLASLLECDKKALHTFFERFTFVKHDKLSTSWTNVSVLFCYSCEIVYNKGNRGYIYY
jgi:hypothetical protein